MKTCLAKFHHSTFYAEGDKPKEGGEGDDGKGGRKINVELTYASGFSCPSPFILLRFFDVLRKGAFIYRAGGGGTSKDRREKLSAKNEKLNEERKRKMREEEKLKLEKQVKNAEENGNKGIHPSRLARIEGDGDGVGTGRGWGDGYEDERRGRGERSRGGGRGRGSSGGNGGIRRGGRGGGRGGGRRGRGGSQGRGRGRGRR